MRVTVFSTVQLRRLVHIVNGGTPSADPANWSDEVPWATPVDLNRVHGGKLNETARTISHLGSANGAPIVPKGSVLLSTRAPVGYTAVMTTDMAFNQGCKALVPRTSDIDPRFLRYCLQAAEQDLDASAQGTTFIELNAQSLAEIAIPSLNLSDQRIISDYLDHETAEIDAFISDFSSLETLVAEQLEVRIDQIFARLTQQYGEQRQKLAWNAKIASGRSIPDASENASPTNTVPVYGGNGLVGFTSRPMVSERSVVIGRVGALCGNVHLSPPRVWVTDNALLVEMISDKYLASYLALALENENLNNRADRTAQPLITGGMVRSLRLPTPPHSDQLSVVNRVTSYQENASGLIHGINEAIDLAHERRAALVSAAVTGQIDVTEKRKPVAEVLEDEVGIRL